MANKNNSSPNPTYYVSPTGKIHADSCRYCQADKDGWQKLDSLEKGLEKNYQLCRLCCPSQEEIIASQTPSDQTKNLKSENPTDDTPIMTQEKSEGQTLSDSDSSENKATARNNKQKSSKDSKEEKPIDNQAQTPKDSKKEKSEDNQAQTPEDSKKEKSEDSQAQTPEDSKGEKSKDSQAQTPEDSKKEKSEDNQAQTPEDSKGEKSKDNKEEKPKGNKGDKTKGKKEQTKGKDSQKKSEPPAEKKRYKILAGNGCHQAIAEVLGILIPPAEGEKSFRLILPDGLQLEATFKNPRLAWLAHNKPELLGQHWFRGYPKMKDDKLVSLQIIAWDGAMPTNPRGDEMWEFTGVWTLQKNITVQRSMMLDDVRKIAKETGFIKKFKYTFSNSFDWVKNKKLWAGYVYKVLCKRNGDVLEIKKVIPYACPRIKPVPKQAPPRGNKPFNSGNKPFNKDGKPQFPKKIK